MQWCSAISAHQDLMAAVHEASAAVRAKLGRAEPNLILAFVSEHHRSRCRDVTALVGSEFGSGLLLGCMARGVVGGGVELEEGPAVSLTAASLPGVSLRPFHLGLDALPEATASADVWRTLIGSREGPDPHFLLLADPFSSDVERVLRGLDGAFPDGKKIGGLASGGGSPGENALYLGTQVHRSGLIGVALSGNLEVDAIVAQGCRPIGAPMFITRCRENVLLELDGRAPLDVLRELYQTLSPHDQKLCRGSLFLGIEMKASRAEYQQGDFLIRNLLGSDPEGGALSIGAILQPTQVVQFHLRDARTSHDDLERRLEQYASTRFAREADHGAVLFSCLGRGSPLYGEPNHDSAALRRHLGDIALGGFFCNGEIGPVEGTTFLHGYTSAFGIFRARNR